MFMFFSFFLFLCSVKNHKKNHANKTLKECKVNPDNAKYISGRVGIGCSYTIEFNSAHTYCMPKK